MWQATSNHTFNFKSLTYSLNELASSLYALIVCVLPFGQITVTVTIFTSASEAEIAGKTLSILQFIESNFLSSKIDCILVSKTRASTILDIDV